MKLVCPSPAICKHRHWNTGIGIGIGIGIDIAHVQRGIQN